MCGQMRHTSIFSFIVHFIWNSNTEISLVLKPFYMKGMVNVVKGCIVLLCVYVSIYPVGTCLWDHLSATDFTLTHFVELHLTVVSLKVDFISLTVIFNTSGKWLFKNSMKTATSFECLTIIIQFVFQASKFSCRTWSYMAPIVLMP